MSEMKIPHDFEQRVHSAIQFFWTTRDGQISRQVEHEIHDQGNRGAVTGGKQLDGFVDLIKDILIDNGIKERHIFFNTNLELPGFYRPNKKWDLLVVDDNQLVLAIEFKSQVGPSFGNNFNNRTEEAMGSALDIWTAYREGVFGSQKAPWLGYLIVLEDSNKSASPVATRSPHFNVMLEFVDASYRKRYEIFCNKLVLERQYDAACFITTKRDDEDIGNFQFPAENLSLVSFVSSMLGAVLAHNIAKG